MPLPLLLSLSEFSYFSLSSPVLRISESFGPVDKSGFLVKTAQLFAVTFADLDVGRWTLAREDFRSWALDVETQNLNVDRLAPKSMTRSHATALGSRRGDRSTSDI